MVPRPLVMLAPTTAPLFPQTQTALSRGVSQQRITTITTTTHSITMSIGLTDDVGRPLFDPEQAPWSSQHVKVKDQRALSYVLRLCIFGRHTSGAKPWQKKWGVDRSTAWLKDHPINWQKDEISNWHENVEFLRDEEIKGSIGKTEQNAVLEGRWIGKEPMLRLIHCLIEDDAIKSAFIRCHNSKDRMQLKNQNSAEKRDPTRDFNPKTMTLDIEGQSDFLDEIALDYSSVQHFAAATPDKCETKFDEMMVALKRIIQNWEASGQGEGGVNNEDKEEEGLEINVRHELGICETFDLTQSCMQTLKDSVTAGDGGYGVPLLFDHHTNADLMQRSDGGSYMGSSKGSKSGSRASNSNTSKV
ncbi:LOW QUALITY PROTEIN: hypothetical protein HJC23_004866 [Cyclotella cryptica]|uniref:Uncharacterized protein n=1 Tax=Cyclotella cryptica TaxID=29204 RepID=A0ABD3P6S8_9STRA